MNLEQRKALEPFINDNWFSNENPLPKQSKRLVKITPSMEMS